MARKFERLTHHGNIVDGRLVLASARYFRGMLQQFENAPVVITLERKKKNRSKQQMGYYWGVVLPLISEHTGHSCEDLHDIFKSKFLRRKRVWRGGDITTLRSTSDLSTNEMAEFLTNVIQEAAELEIAIPEPDKEYQWH